MTHRDPTDVILSVADLYADIIGRFTDQIDRPYIGSSTSNTGRWAWNERCSSATAAPMIGSTTSTFARCRTIPIGEVPGLYAWLGEPVSDEFEARMQSWWDHAAAEREPSSHADPVAFGIDFDEVRPLFADVRESRNGLLTDR